MRSDFTEFSYGFAALNELVARLRPRTGLAAAPVLPTLRHENTVGYDARLDTVHGVFILQFKSSARLTTRRAREWGTYQRPYYAFDLRNTQRSPQHDMLCDLEASLPVAAVVSYVAPAFYTLTQFNLRFVDGTVLDASVWVPPLGVGRTRVGDQHRICFADQNDRPLRFSKEPTSVESLTFERVLDYVGTWAEREPVSVPEAITTVADTLRRAGQRSLRRADDPVDEIKRLAWTADLHVVLVGRQTATDRAVEPDSDRWIEHDPGRLGA